jgi:hypothetical protein
MTAKDKVEVREMMNDIFGNTLHNIEEHLKNSNGKLEIHEGKLEEHGRIINQNLPHNISHCAQVGTIEKLKEDMISAKAIRNYIIAAFGVMGTVIGVIYVLFEIFNKG